MAPTRNRACLIMAASLALLGSTAQAAPGSLRVTFLGRHATGFSMQSAAEMPTYDVHSRRLFVVNSGQGRVEVLDLRQPTSPRALPAIDLRPYGGAPTCVAAHAGVVAVTVPHADRVQPGSVVFFNTDGRFLGRVMVGALPDMLTFTPDGRYLLVANEGEPSDYCEAGLSHDPEGSISIIRITESVECLVQFEVRTAGFGGFSRSGLDPRIRISGPHASVAQDLEPEYIAVSPDSRTAFVTLQENNAIAVVDVQTAAVIRLLSLGTKDHSRGGQGLDPSDRDGAIRIAPWPVRGMYQPDAIATYQAGGGTYLVTANEGDARSQYQCFTDQIRVQDLVLDPAVLPAEQLQAESRLGRLNVSRTDGDANGDGKHEALFSFGGRSFSIWSTDGPLVFDSGQEFEEVLARELPRAFNADGEATESFDSRSDDRGPEPEGLAVGRVGDRTFAFVGLERPSGVMVYDITRPQAPAFVQYVHSRESAGGSGSAGDAGPEGVLFIDPRDSPTGEALLVVANEVSGTIALYGVSCPTQ